ncbi:MAG: hypothetical protein NTY18_14380, partial [Deltaproteobacteria bacterium]|nr:hypothetical protein [Deltaproteobacteria bacterium]
ERLGGAPRVADSPTLASALCRDGARLLVYEHGGRDWLTLCTDLRDITGPDLVVIVALPPEHAADVALLSASASAVVAWGGQGQPLLEAANRVLAAREAPPSPPRRTGPVMTPQPARIAVRPPLATPPPRPVMTPSPRPTATPAPVRVAPPATRLPAPSPADPGAGLFDSIFDEEAVADPATPEAAPADPQPSPSIQPPPPSIPAAFAVWPGTVLSAADGQAVMRAALSGLWPEPRLRPVTEKLAACLSTAEKGATLGQKLPFDPVPVRRAVGLRWQVAAALDTIPSRGAKVDQEAVRAILGGIDEVLADLKTLSDDASPDALRAIEAVRHALVKEAIDLTEALQQVAPPEMVEEITKSRKARKAAGPVTRMVYTEATGHDRGPRQVPWGLVVVLAVSVAGAAAYHGYRFVNRPKQSSPTIAGAPSGTVGTVTPQGKVVVAPAGAKLDPKEVESFKNLERAKGNEVRELLPGTFVVTPRSAKPESSTGGSGRSAQGAKP